MYWNKFALLFIFIFNVRYMERYELYGKVCSEECTIPKRHAVYYGEIGRLCATDTSFLSTVPVRVRNVSSLRVRKIFTFGVLILLKTFASQLLF